MTADWQRITNPAYNPDRGLIDVWSLRPHAEFRSPLYLGC